MNRVLLLGAFGYLTDKLDGQTIKTRDIYRMLCENHKGKVDQFDTLKVKQTKNLFLLFVLFGRLLRANVVVIAPASHAMATLYPVIYYLSFILRYEIVMTCVGGWQVEFFLGGHGYTPHPKELKISKKIKAFLPEMNNVNNYIVENLGFKNSEVFPNFRYIPKFEIKPNNQRPFKVVFMARVDIMKGYDTVFSFAEYVRDKKLEVVIDFYGQLEPGNEQDFLEKLEKQSDIVKYHGALKPAHIYSTLSTYDVLVLPTKYYTEGFPGSILDAYISGIPVVVTEWKHSHEFVKDGESGFIVPFEECQSEFNERLLELYYDYDKLQYMKKCAKIMSLKYSSTEAWRIISKYL